MTSAPGKITVPASRPSQTIPLSHCSAYSRSLAFTNSRTPGCSLTCETQACTSGALSSSSLTSRPNRWVARPSVRVTTSVPRLTNQLAKLSPGVMPFLSIAMVMMRYTLPESRATYSKVSASKRAAVDLPLPAGPSMAITTRSVTVYNFLLVEVRLQFYCTIPRVNPPSITFIRPYLTTLYFIVRLCYNRCRREGEKYARELSCFSL